MRSDVGVVIVHYHREASLRELLESLPAQGVPYVNVVVCDNGSDDVLIQDARRVSAHVRWLELPNPGYAGAVNAGVRALPHEVSRVVVLTHEVRLLPRVIDALVGELETDPTVGLVGPKLLDQSTGGLWSLGGRLTRFGRPKHIRLQGVGAAAADKVVADWLDGACFAFRRADLEAIGGLCELFFLYFEDVDLGLRVRHRLDKRVVVLTGVVATQSAGGTLDQYLAVRNLLWMYSLHRMWFARYLLIAESGLRLLVGPMLRPSGAVARQRARWKGLRAGWSVPGKKRTAGSR